MPNLPEYIFANNYFTAKRFHEVIAKVKWCSFFAPQCIYNIPVAVMICVTLINTHAHRQLLTGILFAQPDKPKTIVILSAL